MNKLLISLITIFILFSCKEKHINKYILDGYLTNFVDSTKIEIDYIIFDNSKGWVNKNFITYLKNGHFSFEDFITELTIASLYIDSIPTSISIFLEPGDIKFTIDKIQPYLYNISNISVDKELKELNQALYLEKKIHFDLNKEKDRLVNRFTVNGNVNRDSLLIKGNQLSEKSKLNIIQRDEIVYDFIHTHINYKITPALIFKLANNIESSISLDSLTNIYYTLPEKSKVTMLGKLAKKQIEVAQETKNIRSISLNQIAPNFHRKSIQGDYIELANFRSGYWVLLDFWASWCGPCLKELPNLKQIKKYDNLKIISITSDSKKMIGKIL